MIHFTVQEICQLIKLAKNAKIILISKCYGFLHPVCYRINVLLKAQVDFLLGHVRTEGTSPVGFLMAADMSADVYI